MRHATYLKNLIFDNKLENSIQAKYLRNPRLLVLVLLIIIIFGSYSYVNIPRRLNPEIKIPFVVVSTVYPGASADDVESLVTDPLESAIGGLNNIDKYTSTSRDSVSIIQIQFNTGINADDAATSVTSAVDNVTLPKDAQSPDVSKVDFEKFPVWTFSLTSKKGDGASVISFSKRLQDSLEATPSIDEVTVSGLEETEVQILIKPEAITTYGFNPQILIATLTNATKSFPAGVVRTDNSSFTLSIDPAVTKIEDIRQTKINLNGSVIPLSDIAVVSERSKPAQSQSFLEQKDGSRNQSVSFSIYKNENADIGKVVKDAQKVTDELISRYDDQFIVFTSSNISEQIDKQFFELIRDFILTVILVFVALLIFLGIRQAVVASVSIPLTFLISFIIMYLTGVSLSFISFFSLLLALGLLVDDTIVVISAMTTYFRSGRFTPYQTGILVWKDYLIVIFTTTLTTVWAFLPLLLSGGIIGEFIKPIPIVVSSTLLASFFVAMFITLPVIAFILKPKLPSRVKGLIFLLGILILFSIIFFVSGKGPLLVIEAGILVVILFLVYKFKDSIYKGTYEKAIKPARRYHQYFDQGFISFEKLSYRYMALITKILNSPRWIKMTVTFVVLFSLFSYLLLPLGLVKTEFFPKSEQDSITITVELPAGTNIEASKREAERVFNILTETEYVEAITLDLGASAGQFGEISGSEANNFLFTLVLEKNRGKSSFEITEDIRNKFSNYSVGKFSVQESTGGPPVGADVQINISGPDIGELDNYANQISSYLSKQAGITNIDKSIKPGTSKVVFSPDKQKLAANGVSNEQIGLILRTFASGTKISTVKLDNTISEEQDLTLRFSSQTEFVENIGSLTLTNSSFQTVPLLSLGELKLESSPTVINHENGDRTISITASVKKGFSIPDSNKNLQVFANTLNLSSGYSWKTGGNNEENQKSVQSILVAMVLSFILIIVTMVLQFSSFRKAFIVILVIPISISGVFIIFALTGTTLSFPALIGVLALFGIVVKNSILIVDKIQANEKTNMGFVESIAEGSASRLEPIALTSLTAILGLIPITLSDPLWRGLGGAIISGLTFSGTIMLFFIPAVYYLTFKSSRKTKEVSPVKN